MQIVPATLAHALELAGTLRAEDIREMRSVNPSVYPPAALARAVGCSSSTFAAVTPEGKVICLGGVAPRGDGSGSVWLMGSVLMDSHRIALARATPHCIKLMHKAHRIIHNCADSRNTVHLAWLRWAGFGELPPITSFAADGTPFIPFFHIEEPPCASQQPSP